MRARPRKTFDANSETSTYFTAGELLIYAASASEHRSHRGRVDHVRLHFWNRFIRGGVDMGIDMLLTGEWFLYSPV